MQRWAEVVLCCGADWGCVPQLWNRVVLRKWLNIGAGSGDSDFSADERSDGEADREGYFSAAPFLERSVLTSKFPNRSVCSNLLLFGGKLGRIWFRSLSGRR